MTLDGTPIEATVGRSLPSWQGRRDVLVLLGFVAVLVILFVLLWLHGPLPHLFPQVPGGLVPSPAR
ncbi:MAG: hypothetical protein JO352_23875 [Chloroflexi bacterium]|nr:hypothetical protein [Chloroflexota bacterium]MBV9597219.1 hypothetical protein [Chloroflexota bacterium]